MNVPLLECVRCRNRHSVESILNGDYILETFVCGVCYATMQQMPYSQSCFGKSTDVTRKLNGYNPNARECQYVCPDRNVCSIVVMGISRENYVAKRKDT